MKRLFGSGQPTPPPQKQAPVQTVQPAPVYNGPDLGVIRDKVPNK